MNAAKCHTIGICIAVAMLTSTRSASAYNPNCWYSGLWLPQTIEVYINDALESSPGANCIQGGAGIASPAIIGYDLWEFTRAVQMATSRWNESGARIRLKYAGFTSAGCVPGGIVM